MERAILGQEEELIKPLEKQLRLMLMENSTIHTMSIQ